MRGNVLATAGGVLAFAGGECGEVLHAARLRVDTEQGEEEEEEEEQEEEEGAGSMGEGSRQGGEAGIGEVWPVSVATLSRVSHVCPYRTPSIDTNANGMPHTSTSPVWR